MRKETLYSSSSRSRQPAVTVAQADPAPTPPTRRFHFPRPLASWLFAIGLLVALGLGVRAALMPAPRTLTQADIDAAVLHTLEKPNAAFAGREGGRDGPSVGRARARHRRSPHKDRQRRCHGVGSGVVDRRQRAHPDEPARRAGRRSRSTSTFADGLESEATSSACSREHDLAVLQAKQASRRPGRRRRCARRKISCRARRWSPWASRSASARRCRRA